MTEMGDILFEKRGAAGLITLNRPQALNALTHEMVVAMKARLDAWATDPEISCVVVRGAGERAFCAGGDIRALAESGRTGTTYALDFWRDEYILNAAIKHYPKPYLALISGFAMGGGLGISVHGNYRVADETTQVAMPDTGSGFFPDVGSSYFLSRCPGEIGMYLALTGARLKTADALYAGIATHLVRAETRPILMAALAHGENPADLLSKIAVRPVPKAPLAEQCVTIDNIFCLPSVEEILQGLDEHGDEWTVATAATIRGKSPTSLKITFREVREGRTLSFDDCMRMEFRISSRIRAGYNFLEGVRVTVVDKDDNAKWQPATLAEVSDDVVDSYFAPLADQELLL
jgi:enoyl-CoA hydratase